MNRRLVAAGAALVAAVASSAAAAPSERVTIEARPTVLGRSATAVLFGTIASARAGEVVTVQARECGQQSFRGVTAATTRAGGAWSTSYSSGINVTYRAVWDDAVSAPVTVRERAHVVVDQLSPGRFEVGVGGKAQFWRKRVLFQRFDRRLGRWSTLRTVVLTETVGGAGGIWSGAKVRVSVPKGSLVRAVLPLSQARPCYLEGYSNMLRT